MVSRTVGRGAGGPRLRALRCVTPSAPPDSPTADAETGRTSAVYNVVITEVRAMISARRHGRGHRVLALFCVVTRPDPAP